jgi:hypothetical protein
VVARAAAATAVKMVFLNIWIFLWLGEGEVVFACPSYLGEIIRRGL